MYRCIHANMFRAQQNITIQQNITDSFNKYNNIKYSWFVLVQIKSSSYQTRQIRPKVNIDETQHHLYAKLCVDTG